MSSQIRPSRSRSYIDPSVQGALMRKLSFHWLLLIVVNCVVFGGWVWLFERTDSSASDAMSTAFAKCMPFLVTSVALLPVFLFDTLRLTSRFAGPALRLRAALSDAANGLPVRPLKFRQDDFWQEMADSFNTVMERKNEPLRLAEESSTALAANGGNEMLTKQPVANDSSSSLGTRSADEAIRLLDSVNV
jgi:hypothetical protein